MTSRRTVIRSAALAAGAPLLPLSAFAQSGGPIRVGYVYVSPIGDAGWTFQHDLGRREMEKALGAKVQTRFIESVSEGADAERVIRELAQSGHNVIFGTSFGYMNPMERVAKQFPKVAFVHATGYKQGPNLGIYHARFYEGRYLTGLVAGRMTQSNVLGYVAAFPIPEVLQGINAFTLAARSVNPKVEVRVIWVNSWYDPGKERDAANTLIAQGADVVTHHTDSTAVVQAAQERGRYAIGYHSDMSKYGAKAHLTAATHHWGEYYIRTINEAIAGTWKPGSLWGGIKEGMVGLAPLNPAVPADVREQVSKVQAQIKAGSFHPFSGPIVDQDGKERLAAGRTMDDAALGSMDYYVQGVGSRLPKK
jgi:simple sugar transport system substrate-binding protein